MLDDWLDNELFNPLSDGEYLCKVRRLPNPFAKYKIMKYENKEWITEKREHVIKWRDI